MSALRQNIAKLTNSYNKRIVNSKGYYGVHICIIPYHTECTCMYM